MNTCHFASLCSADWSGRHSDHRQLLQ